MLKRVFSAVMFILLLTGLLTLAFNIQPVKASGTIYIRADGNIDPPTTPIQRDGDHYTLTDNITASADGIVIERDNMTLDGTDHTVQGPAPYVAYCKGINLSGRKNVTIKNIEIRAFDFGIYLNYSSDSNIHRNNIKANNLIGFVLQSSSNNGITTNNITYNYYGIQLRGSDNNCISGNQIVRNGPGIGIALISSSNNTLYHNNFIDNAFDVSSDDYANWDDGYPSGGNYWSDYNGTDVYSGLYQNETGSDGIGDTPHVIDTDNQDRYPLMHPWSSLPVHNMNTGFGYVRIQEAMNANETLDGHTLFVEAGVYYEDVVINKAISLIGESRQTTIIDANETGTPIETRANGVKISGFTVQKNIDGYGIYLNNSNYCSITENSITNAGFPIRLEWSSNNVISKNNITNNFNFVGLYWSLNNIISENSITANTNGGIGLTSSFRNWIFGNNITNNKLDGIHLSDSSDNSMSGNSIVNNWHAGISLYSSSNNTIFRNSIVENGYRSIKPHEGYGIWLSGSSDNLFYHNDFINNTNEVWSFHSTNKWDHGYPYGGNYWSDYNGTDLYNGPLQNLTGSDGIGDIPYVIDADNQDRYPLMHPWSPLPVHNINTGLGYATIQEAINAPETLDGHTIFVEAGTYHEHVVVNKTHLSLFGESGKTIVDGDGTGSVIYTEATGVNISGFTIQHGTGGVVNWGGFASITNNTIIHCSYGIYFERSAYSNTIINNTIRLNNYGICIPVDAYGTSICNNKVMDNNYGISINPPLEAAAHDTIVSGNVIANNRIGIELWGSDRGTLIGNQIANNTDYGIDVNHCTDNKICHNNFVNNTQQVHSVGSINMWDDGYPSGGNYWSDYTGIDMFSGLYQNETGSDGIGDTPYVIDENNQDRYPPMQLYVPLLGDLNQDGIVNILDAIQAASAFGSYPGHPKWNEQADLNKDNVVDIFDLIILASNFGRH